jgi:hypothetical protein
MRFSKCLFAGLIHYDGHTIEGLVLCPGCRHRRLFFDQGYADEGQFVGRLHCVCGMKVNVHYSSAYHGVRERLLFKLIERGKL